MGGQKEGQQWQRRAAPEEYFVGAKPLVVK